MDVCDFCAIAGRIIKIDVDLVNIKAKVKKEESRILNELNQGYLFCSATETVSGLESICWKLSQMETEVRQWTTSLESNVKVSVLLEAFEPVLSVVEEITPYTARLKDNQQLMIEAGQAFGTLMFTSGMNRLVSRSMEGVYCLIMGKMFYEGMVVEVDYKKSTSFFQCAANYDNCEGFDYLARQYGWSWGMIKDKSKVVELYMKRAELEDPECFYLMGVCFHNGFRMEKDDAKGFEYYMKAANLGDVISQTEVGHCLYNGMGTEVDVALSAKYYMAAAEAGDEHALCEFGHCLSYVTGVERNEKFAVKLFKIAASAGSTEALMRMGDCYGEGLGGGIPFL